jgi:secreted Zn-dependent insulinase-like peptidase
VQSTGAPADHLEKVTIEFIEQQLSMIPYIPAEAFDQHKSGLISRLTKSDENLGQRHSRFWADLESDVTTFDSNQRVARAVVPLETGDVIEFLSELRTKLDDQRLFVFSRGKFDTFPENGSIVNSTADLK